MFEDVTVLIANLGQLENLRSCLKSIFDSGNRDSSVRVVVGFNFEGESDCPRMLAREFPQVSQLRARSKLGYCRAYNQLMARGAGRYFLLLDDDTVLGPGAIDGMVRFMDAHPDVGIAGCRTFNRDGSYQKSTGRMFSLKTELINVFRPAAFWNDGIDATVATWKSVGWLNAHFLMVRARVVAEVGGFDEFYYTIQCEPDWCLRIRHAGWKVAYVPDVEVMHLGGAHSVATAIKSRANLLRSHINRYYFIRKHYGDATLHLFRFIMSAGAMLRLLKYATVWIFSPGRRPEAGPKVDAYWRIALLGAKTRPEDLPEELRRQYAESECFEPSIQE